MSNKTLLHPTFVVPNTRNTFFFISSYSYRDIWPSWL